MPRAVAPQRRLPKRLRFSRRLQDAVERVPLATDGASRGPGPLAVLVLLGSGSRHLGAVRAAQARLSWLCLPAARSCFPGWGRGPEGGGHGGLLSWAPPAAAPAGLPHCDWSPSRLVFRTSPSGHHRPVTLPWVTSHGVRAGGRLGGKGSSPHPCRQVTFGLGLVSL